MANVTREGKVIKQRK